MFNHIYRVLIVAFLGHTHLLFVVYLVEIYPNFKQYPYLLYERTIHKYTSFI